ncbi:MAG: hypothetical protein WCV68_02965 [Candidatus Paceibacterota bacterium]|jgi:hypothetical protein
MNNLELEIAQLQQKIEEKKNQLEQQGGIVEEKELVGSALREIFTGASAPSGASLPATSAAVTAKASTVTDDKSISYLDNIDDQTAETISLIIQKLPETGIAKAVSEAELAGPFLVDVLHDALVDRMYDELVQRGFIKTK